MMKRSLLGALWALSLAACPPPTGTTQPTQERLPPVSAETRQVKAVPYSRTASIAWPRDARRRQLVISGGWQPDERFAWLIADGARVVVVYRLATREDLNDLLGKIGQGLVLEAPGTPGDERGWAIAGAIPIPDPPPPPEPGGFPWDYIQRVLMAAYRANQVSQPMQLESGKTLQQP